jgi:DNA adenine methylase
MALSYIGGKKKMQSWIVPFIPKDTETYCEPFSGQFWIFFGMKLDEYPNLTKIIYNDVNPLNYNLYMCISDHKRLLKECEKIVVQEKGQEPTNPLCEEQFNEFQSEIFDNNFKINYPDYTVAAKYAYVLTQVFSGANPEKSKFIDLKGKYHSKFTSFKNKLKNEKWQKMFESITNVENVDFQRVIEKYDSPKTFFYTDPPYYIVGEGDYYSNHNFSRNDHERLSNTLKVIDGKFGLSYYDFPLLHQWFPQETFRWEEKEFVKAAAAKKGVKQNLGKELLILNY